MERYIRSKKRRKERIRKNKKEIKELVRWSKKGRKERNCRRKKINGKDNIGPNKGYK